LYKITPFFLKSYFLQRLDISDSDKKGICLVRDNFSHHHLPGVVPMRFHSRSHEYFGFGHQHIQPPGEPFIAEKFSTSNQVSVADQSGQRAAIISRQNAFKMALQK
jgi:hypothetical protein